MRQTRALTPDPQTPARAQPRPGTYLDDGAPPALPVRISSLRELCLYFGVSDPMRLNHAVYTRTRCGASIFVRTCDGQWYQDSADWSGIAEITAFTIQATVECSGITVDSRVFKLPVFDQQVEEWIEHMDEVAEGFLRDANEGIA